MSVVLRRSVVACAVALALTVSVPAIAVGQSDHAFTSSASYHVRLALGDIPSTSTREAAGSWNVHEVRLIAHATGTDSVVRFLLPDGSNATGLSCSCGEGGNRREGALFEFTIPAATSTGNYSVSFSHASPVREGVPRLMQFSGLDAQTRSAATLVFYVPMNYSLVPPIPADFVLPSTSENPGLEIQQFSGTPSSPLPEAAVFILLPVAPVAPAGEPASPAAPATSSSGWPWFLAGAVAGILLSTAANLVTTRFLPSRRNGPSGPNEEAERTPQSEAKADATVDATPASPDTSPRGPEAGDVKPGDAKGGGDDEVAVG